MNDDSRGHALTGRLAAHHLLDAPASDLARCTPLSTGLQDAGPGTADAALALRLTGGPHAVRAARGSLDVVTVLSLRGAPHLHRRQDVPWLRRALVPASVSDLEVSAGPLPDAVRSIPEPVTVVARALDAALGSRERMSKAELSTACTRLVDDALTPWCRPCKAAHTVDGVFRLATLRAGLHLVPGTSTQTFARLPETTATSPTGEAPAELLTTAAGLAAPADGPQLAAWLGWTRGTVRTLLRQKAVPHPTPAPHLTPAPDPHRRARLLPARDVWLRGSDRAWLMGSHGNRRGEVFRSLGAPGVVLLAGELVGTWRTRTSGAASLRVMVDLWQPLPGPGRDEIASDAEVVAAVRGRRAELVVG